MFFKMPSLGDNISWQISLDNFILLSDICLEGYKHMPKPFSIACDHEAYSKIVAFNSIIGKSYSWIATQAINFAMNNPEFRASMQPHVDAHRKKIEVLFPPKQPIRNQSVEDPTI